MIPREEEAAGDQAGVADLAAGVVRTSWPWLLGVGLAVVAVAFVLWGANRPDDPAVTDTAGSPDGLVFSETARLVGDDCLLVLVADDLQERVAGLRDRLAELERVDGMLFVSDGPSTTGFTMSEVVQPLSLAFFDVAGKRLGGHEMAPCADSQARCPGYPPPEGTQWSFALETAPGRMPPGDLGGPCQKE